MNMKNIDETELYEVRESAYKVESGFNILHQFVAKEANSINCKDKANIQFPWDVLNQLDLIKAEFDRLKKEVGA